MINKERIRQKLANIKNGTIGDNNYWTVPKEGKATVRVVPYPHGEDPFLEYFLHYNISRTGLICPVKNGLGNSCPICDMAASLYRSEKPGDKEASKKLYARKRYWGLVVDRSDETKTPKWWGFSQTNYIKFLNWLQEDNGDYENFLDLKHGLDVDVFLESTPGKSFASAAVQPKRRETPLGTAEEIDQILKSVKPASEVFKVLSASELGQKLNEWANGEESSAQEDSVEKQNADSEGTVKGGGGEKKEKAKRFTSKSVDEAFDQLEEQL